MFFSSLVVVFIEIIGKTKQKHKINMLEEIFVLSILDVVCVKKRRRRKRERKKQTSKISFVFIV